MIEKKIKAKEDFQFTNFTGTHYFVEGEVKRVKFINQRAFEAHLATGRMVEAALEDEEGKSVDVVYPPDMEDAIVSVGPVDPIDPPEGIEPDKFDLPCPLEDHIEDQVEIPEDLVHDELSIEEVVPEQEIVEQPEIEEFKPDRVDENRLE